MAVILEKGDIIQDYCDNGSLLIIQQNDCTAVKIDPYFFAGKLAENLPYSSPYAQRKSWSLLNSTRVSDCLELGSICF